MQTTKLELPAHSKLGASSYHRWGSCPGSVKLCESVSQPTASVYAMEGTNAHSAAEHYFKYGELPKGISFEMAEAVMVYVNAVFEEQRKAHSESSCERHIEVKFHLDLIDERLFGTSDCVIWYPGTRKLQVWDYKHGAGIPVEVEGNEQLLYYALGAIVQLGFDPETVELVIVQPRCPHPDGPVRRWECKAKDVTGTFARELSAAVKATDDPNAPLVAGDHCRFCPAASICPKIHERALATAQDEFSPTFSYDPAKLSQALRWLPTLKAWASQVEDFALNELKAGRGIPGWKLVEGRGRRAWVSGVGAEDVALETGLALEQILSEPELKSPAQVEKLLEGKEERKLLETLVTKESGSLQLAPETDKRPAARPDAALEFNPL